MKRKSFRILLFLRKGKLLKNGEAPICMRITVDKRVCDILIKRSILPEQWNQTKECAKGDEKEMNYSKEAKWMKEDIFIKHFHNHTSSNLFSSHLLYILVFF